jgi:hypothetical protein
MDLSRFPRFALSAAWGAALCVAAPSAFGHARLVSPAPRSTSDGIKSGAPCGPGSRSANPTYVKPGSTLTVSFEETIDHQGCFIVQLLKNNVPYAPAVVEKKADPVNTGVSQSAPRAESVQITLPNVDCDDCTLQLQQVMVPAAQNLAQCPGTTVAGDIYFSCSDIRITNDPPPIVQDAGTPDASSPPPDVEDAPPPAAETPATSLDAGTSKKKRSDAGLGADDSGGGLACAAAPRSFGAGGSSSGLPGGTGALAVTFGLVGMGLVRHRRRRRSVDRA